MSPARFTPDRGSSSQTVNFRGDAKLGISQRARLDAIVGNANVGVSMSQAPSTLLTRNSLGVGHTQLQIDLTHTSHVVTAAQDAGTGTWNDPANLQGAPQGTQAGSASYSAGLVLGSRKLRGTAMAAQPNRPASLIIDSVWLTYYYQTTGLPAVSDLVSNLAVGAQFEAHAVPGGDTFTFVTSNENHLADGVEFRVDTGTGQFFVGTFSTPITWASIATIQPFFGANTIANGLMTYFVDAVRLRVVAHETTAL